jgi:aminoglycoside phosphotransferase (APT) family kinase protein
MSPAAIMHGDYSPYNVMVANQPPVRLAAIVDWDTGTIGDPLLDLGHLLARWVQPGKRGPLDPSEEKWCDRYPTRDQMACRYQETTGRDLSAPCGRGPTLRWRGRPPSAPQSDERMSRVD